MKGTPDMPQCGFSRAVCQILEVQGVKADKMKAFNCLADAELREGIKEYSSVSPPATRSSVPPRPISIPPPRCAPLEHPH